MLSPTIVEQVRNGIVIDRRDFVARDHALCYIPALDAPTMRHEREVYETDPTGGPASRY